MTWSRLRPPRRLTCSLVAFFMRGHAVTTCWWHRLWTTQVHTELKGDTEGKFRGQTGVASQRFGKRGRGRRRELLTLALVALLAEDAPEMGDRHGHVEPVGGAAAAAAAAAPYQMNSLQWKQKVGCRR